MTDISVYEKQIKKKRKTGIPRLLEIAGTKSALLVFAAIFAALAVAAQMTPFVTIYLLVRELITHINNPAEIDTAFVWHLGWLTLGGVALYGLLTYLGNMLSHIAAYNVLYEIRIGLTEKLSRMPMGYFTSTANGKIKKVLQEDVERIEIFVAHHIVDIVQAAFLPLLSLAVLFYIDWRLAVGVVIPLLLATVAQRKMYSPKGMQYYAEWQEKLATMNATIIEYVRGMPVVKIFNQTVSAFKRFSRDVYAYRDLTLQWFKLSRRPFSAFLTLLSSSAVFIIPIAILLVSRVPREGYVPLVSTVFLFLYIAMGISVPFYKLINMSSYLIQIKTGLSSIDDILEKPEIRDTQNVMDIKEAGIEFRNVSFSYDEIKALEDVSFSVSPGSVTALVGPSGGGKTTIANLIGRFWDVGSGEILVGDTNISELGVNCLNNTVSTVFQDVFLFFDTIEENIRMGNCQTDFAEVQAAAEAAQIHDFILTLPQGYQTLIGEGGVYLSGGEQQRVALARVILKNSPIVILDEATAYADPENESKIQKALSVVLKNKTVIVIAHRLYTITEVDQILVVNEGRIEEKGTHRELLEEQGLYRRMWDIHAEARKWNLDQEREVSK